jgi:S1-C subfamily serine protease
VTTAGWSDPIWVLPESTAAAPGSVAFTVNGAFVGIVAPTSAGASIVPADVVMTIIDRTLARGPSEPGSLGIQVQALPAALRSSSAGAGVVVTWVDPQGPLRTLVATDIIEALNGEQLEDLAAWRARMAVMTAGEAVLLRIRRGDVVFETQATAIARELPSKTALGATFRTRNSVGAEVVRVESGSAAEAAGLVEGDLITRIGAKASPSGAEVVRTYASAPEGSTLLVAVTRDAEHRVIALVKKK